jgi:hypothetical protein
VPKDSKAEMNHHYFPVIYKEDELANNQLKM